MLARVASRKAKPAGSYHILPADAPSVLAPMDINDLHGFGYAARQKAQEKLGVTTLGELAKKSKAVLCDALGKGTGETLFKAVRGIDDRKLESDKPRKSVSCDINVCPCSSVSDAELHTGDLTDLNRSTASVLRITSKPKRSCTSSRRKCLGDSTVSI